MDIPRGQGTPDSRWNNNDLPRLEQITAAISSTTTYTLYSTIRHGRTTATVKLTVN
jgi:hypothetical protein